MRYVCLPICLLLLGFLAGCTRQGPSTPPAAEPEESMASSEDVSAEEVRRELGEATEAVQTYSEEKTQEVVENAQKGLDQLKQNVARLKQDVGGLQETARAKFQESVDDLDRKVGEAQQRLDRLRNAGSDAWEESRDDLQKALDNLQRGYTDAARAFQEANVHGAKTKPAETPSESE